MSRAAQSIKKINNHMIRVSSVRRTLQKKRPGGRQASRRRLTDEADSFGWRRATSSASADCHTGRFWPGCSKNSPEVNRAATGWHGRARAPSLTHLLKDGIAAHSDKIVEAALIRNEITRQG